MSMKPMIVMAWCAVLFVVACAPQDQAMMEEKGIVMETEQPVAAPVDDAITENAMPEPDDDAILMKSSGYAGTKLAGSTSPYYEFAQGDYETALRENKIILLNFYANWCPLCKAEEPDVLAAFNELKNPNIVGFRVNYKDSDTDEVESSLAREFGIPYQHTKVIIQNGEQVLKAPDTWDKQRYLTELRKY